jgi:hypothetical protein
MSGKISLAVKPTLQGEKVLLRPVKVRTWPLAWIQIPGATGLPGVTLSPAASQLRC